MDFTQQHAIDRFTQSATFPDRKGVELWVQV